MSWVTIKKENQISKVPYQAFKDVFESAGFVIIDENLNTSPTFSIPAKSDTNVIKQDTPKESLVENTNIQKEDKKDEKPFRNKKPSSHKHKK